MTERERPVALVTGAAKRIGRAIALELASAGWDVGLHCNRSRAEADALANEMSRLGARAVVLPADLADFNETASLVQGCTQALAAPECLVNNASIFERDGVRDFTAESWQAHQDVNLRAPLLLSQAFAAALPAGREGNIVNLIDQRVLRLNPTFFSYTLSKSALLTATRTMAQALAPHIRVNAIAPGPVLPNHYQTAEDFARECESTLLRHGASPEEIAQAVMFILSARAMTGQMIALDGGEHLQYAE